jgi:vacuolar-type H+-ATPase subunit E/Vma4
MKIGIKEILDIEKKAREIIDEAQAKSDSIRREAEKEAKKIVANANKEAKSIIEGYKLRLSEAQKKEEKKVEKRGMDLENDWINSYKEKKEELLSKLIASSMKVK